jgi:Sensors of blue-light using FAD
VNLVRIIYRSNINRDFSDTVDAIALVASRFNSKHNITGCLFEIGDFYYQILEGPREATLSLLERIKADRRHSHMTILETIPITVGHFSSWAMGVLSAYEVAQIFGAHTAAVKQSIRNVEASQPGPDSTNLLHVFTARVDAVLGVLDQHMLTQIRMDYG